MDKVAKNIDQLMFGKSVVIPILLYSLNLNNYYAKTLHYQGVSCFLWSFFSL